MAKIGWIRLALGVTLWSVTGGVLWPATAADAPFPYELDTGREIAITGTGLALLGLGRVLAGDPEPLTQTEIDRLHRDDVGFLNRSATRNWSPTAARISDYLIGALLASPLALAVTEPGSQRAATVLTMYGEALLLDFGAVNVLKEVVGRTRPYVYNETPAIPSELKTSHDAVRSFPSGHTVNAFTAAVFLSTVFADLNPDSSARGWVWGGSLAAASAIGYLRYQSGRHYPTDVIFGAVLGATIGYLVPFLHRGDDESGDGADSGLSLAYGFAF